MKFKEGQTVTYDSRVWVVTGYGTDENGKKFCYLERGDFQTLAYEDEVKK